MKKGLKQKQRRKQMSEMESKWHPVLKHGVYNNTMITDSIMRLQIKKKLEQGYPV